MSVLQRRRVLVSLLTPDKADLDLARRRIGYDHLVLVAHQGTEERAARVQAEETGATGRSVCTVVPAPPTAVAQHITHLNALLAEHRHDHIVVNAAGGDHALGVAMLIVAFERGLETWFFQHGRAERLPVFAGVHLQERIAENERRLLRILPAEGLTSTVAAELSLVPRPQVERAFRALREKGLVRLSARDGRAHAALTDEGRYLQQHLARGA